MSLTKPLRLITIPVSHYCEKARWSLTKLNIPFIEEAHIPPFHLPVTKRFGGKLTPILIAENQIVHDSTEIIKYLDTTVPAQKRLFPTDVKLRTQVEALEQLFDEKLGVATRRWGYSHTINQPKLITQAWCKDVPKLEQSLLPFVFPIVRNTLKKQFCITESSGDEAYAVILEVFELVGNLLADGRKYLVGDVFTAADLTFAALAAPILIPPQHPKYHRNMQYLPQKMLEEITEIHHTEAGKFGLHLYATERF